MLKGFFRFFFLSVTPVCFSFFPNSYGCRGHLKEDHLDRGLAQSSPPKFARRGLWACTFGCPEFPHEFWDPASLAPSGCIYLSAFHKTIACACLYKHTDFTEIYKAWFWIYLSGRKSFSKIHFQYALVLSIPCGLALFLIEHSSFSRGLYAS